MGEWSLGRWQHAGLRSTSVIPHNGLLVRRDLDALGSRFSQPRRRRHHFVNFAAFLPTPTKDTFPTRNSSASMLYLVGLGLADEKDITVKGLEIVKKAERVYLEAYTAVLLVEKDVLVSPWWWMWRRQR